MTTTINASTSSGLVQTADTSGVIKLQSNGVTTNALAWVNFTGSTAAIKASYNVSSVTRASTGIYTITFTNATTDANYSFFVNGCNAAGNTFIGCGYTSGTQLNTSLKVLTVNGSGSVTDFDNATVAVFGN
jgi:hypothetical protein